MRIGLPIVLVALSLPAAAGAASPPCRPCAGVVPADLAAAAAVLAAEPRLGPDDRLYVAARWEPAAGGAPEGLAAVAAAGGTPWIRATLRTPAPITSHLAALETELAALAELAGSGAAGNHFQILWEPAAGEGAASDYPFLLKRASVAIAGAAPDARVISAPLPANAAELEAVYAQGIAAYIEGVALQPAEPERLAAAAARLAELDPGRPIVVDALALPAEPAEAVARAADLAARGVAVTFFTVPSGAEGALAPLKLLAREFRGDLALDPATAPLGAAAAWTFVRGEDLGLRIIARSAPGAGPLRLLFPDPLVERPQRIDPLTGEAQALFRQRRTAEGLEVEIDDPLPVEILRLDRRTASEVEGVAGLEEAVTVTGDREVPVEEILRRLQALEDAQGRRIVNWRAVNTTHLRFQLGTGARGVEISFRGEFFAYRGERGEAPGFDWAWQEMFVDGVRWRSKWVPDIPLIQPEKAAAMPAEITFTKEYRYRLRGTETVRGRDCWVVDFEPAVAVEPGRTLYQGTVWVDRAIQARVRTRAVQLGLSGDVLSNEETVDFAPLDAAGRPADWAVESYFLPVASTGQQIWSLLSATTVVERETAFSHVAINPPDFGERRAEVLASSATMLRDTEEGMRYLVRDEESGERVVQQEQDLNKRFAVGGVFADESLDFPVPLAGFNWLWLDWRGTGTQANIFFGGALLNVAISDPSFLGSRFDAGLDAFAIAFAGTDTVFRDGRESAGEDVEILSPNIDLKVGRPLGSFFRLGLEYELAWQHFSRADDTDADFVVPTDTLRHEVTLNGTFSRSGYRLRANGTWGLRSDWEPWGRPSGEDFSPGDDTYARWTASFGKVWHLAGFHKAGLELEYADGSGLDRFSKYDFGSFGDLSVHGYQSGKVRAEEALLARLRYGFEVAQLFRLDLLGDTAWATDGESGLDRELLAGVGAAGTITLPWGVVVNLDVGTAVAGPDDGVTAFVTVLKLFR